MAIIKKHKRQMMAKLFEGVASNGGKVTNWVASFGAKVTIGVSGKWWQCNGKS